MRVKTFRLCAVAGAVCVCASARAADFTVINTAPSGPGSLHQAIADANTLPAIDRVVFEIPGAGVQKIDISNNGLPTVTDPVVIDGYTQPGARPNTQPVGNDAVILVQIDGTGSSASQTYGITISAGGSAVRGLCLVGFRKMLQPGVFVGAAIRFIANGGNIVEGNFIGVLPDGKTPGFNATGSVADGVELQSGNNLVGGISPATRNLISGNGHGVLTSGPLAGRSGNQILGNYIGTDANGVQAVPNLLTGVQFDGGTYTDTSVGGSAPGAANLISGNRIGIALGHAPNAVKIAANGIAIQGNVIGAAANGADPLGNNLYGIFMWGSQNLIGGVDANAGNLIAFNGGSSSSAAGVTITDPSRGNRLLSNRVFGNRVIDVDLVGGDRMRAGATSNDLGDRDSGPNLLQNFPIITRVSLDNSTTTGTLEGELNSTPSTEFTLQFFYNDNDSELLGTTTVVTDAQGNARFTFPFTRTAAEPLAEGSYFTATATDPEGNTSEYLPQNGPVQLANISTRGFVGTGANILIGGFIVRAEQSKKLAIRALGPSVNVPNRLQDPYLELYDGDGKLLAKNDDWKTSQQQEVTANGLAPASDVESVIISTLAPGNYTAQVSGVAGRSGNAIVEVYDLDAFTATSGRLVNISTRGAVGTGDNVLIGGLIVRGDAAARVVARAIGPDLSARGVPDALQDPTLELRDASGNLVAENDNWRENQSEEIPPGLQPGDDRDAALVVTVAPGPYTAIVRGKGANTGVALVEFYDLKN
jgi:hypothetical protein